MIKQTQKLLRKSKDWMESFATKPYAFQALFIISFIEASFFPLPPDILLLAIAISAPKLGFKAAFWCAVGSVLGGIGGYYIGYGLMEAVGNRIVEIYNAQEMWITIVEAYNSEVGIWFLAMASFTPVPYKVATIAAGAVSMDFWSFVGVSAIGRAARFFLVGGLIYYIGPSIKIFIDKYFDKLSIAFVILLVGGFVAIKYIF
jgi:membrane protein YqaA with SNARE-associated domain